MTAIVFQCGKVAFADGGVATSCDCDCCKSCCWGACVNKEYSFICYERVNGQIQEVPCPPCGDPCYYNMQASPGFAYVCLVTKTRAECEAIRGVGGSPSIWLGCNSLQTECYFSECQYLWFPLAGSAKGDAYSFCATPVANNPASDLYLEECDP